MKHGWALAILLGAATAPSACTMTDPSESLAESAAVQCGAEGQTCCATGARCSGELGCSGGACRSVITDMVAYTEYCKEQLGFVNPRAKLPFMSCDEAPDPANPGARIATGKQSEIFLTLGQGEARRTHSLLDNGAPIADGKDLWDTIFNATGETCDNPDYLYGRCDPYARLNVWKPDPQNAAITAAIHCRGPHESKPNPANAISGAARRAAYMNAPANASAEEKARLFKQYNDTSVIVLTMANATTGKACFFHADAPYFGSHFPAPDDETVLTEPAAVETVWNELPTKPPYDKTDANHRSEWLRNGASAWHAPNYMQCTSCHDSGPWMHNPFIDSANNLPNDRASRPYVPLGHQAQDSIKFVRTEKVRTPRGEETQKCTSCHQMGSASACNGWFDRALGWSLPGSVSAAARADVSMSKYMPADHGHATREAFYASEGEHVDVMKCCCEHPDWQGCKTVSRGAPTEEGAVGRSDKSCTASTTGGWNQPCDAGDTCNHRGLRCAAGKCIFLDEAPTRP